MVEQMSTIKNKIKLLFGLHRSNITRYFEAHMRLSLRYRKLLSLGRLVSSHTCVITSPPQRVLLVLLTSFSVGMDVALVRGRCVMRLTTVAMGLMSTHITTAVSIQTLYQVFRSNCC